MEITPLACLRSMENINGVLSIKAFFFFFFKVAVIPQRKRSKDITQDRIGSARYLAGHAEYGRTLLGPGRGSLARVENPI